MCIFACEDGLSNKPGVTAFEWFVKWQWRLVHLVLSCDVTSILTNSMMWQQF